MMRLASMAGLLLLSVCGSCRAEADPPVELEEALELADFHVEKNYPLPRRDLLRPTARDAGDRWIVTYLSPEGPAPGTPLVEIDKKTGKVLRAEGSRSAAKAE